MSQDLYAYLHQRSRMDVMRWPMGLALSIGLHVLVIGGILVMPHAAPRTPEVKVTWVSLPAAGGGRAGGSGPLEEGRQGERQRRVEEVAPRRPDPGAALTPSDAPGTRISRNLLSGTNPDPSSKGTSPLAAKGKDPVRNPLPGAAGSGQGGGVGEGAGVPGLKASGGVVGGTGLIGELDGNFPFLWYLQQVQNTITSNWNRLSSAQGRVQIYFRIRRDGRIEGVRVEIPSTQATLDQSALMAVRRSDPLPRLPDGFEGETLGVRFWFTYLGN